MFPDDNYRGAWKDIFNGAVGFGMTAGKDSMSSYVMTWFLHEHLADLFFIGPKIRIPIWSKHYPCTRVSS